MYSKTFGIFSASVLCYAVSGLKEKTATYYFVSLFSHLEDFFVVFLFILQSITLRIAHCGGLD